MLWEPAFHGSLGVRAVVDSSLPALASPVQALDAANTALFFQDVNGTQPAANGSAVARANDVNGGAYFFRQQVAGERPTLVTNAANGKPVLRFNGTSWMAVQNAPTGFIDGGERFRSTTFTMIAVFRIPDALAVNDGSGIFAAGNSTGGEGGNAFDNLTLQALSSGWPSLARHSGSEYRNIYLSGVTDTYNQIMKVIARGAPANGLELRAKSIAGSFTGTTTVAPSADSWTWDFAALGAEMGNKWGDLPANRLRFDLMEFRFWNTRASDAQAAQLMTYLDAKWGN